VEIQKRDTESVKITTEKKSPTEHGQKELAVETQGSRIKQL
jgi:hypothetical protein